MFTYQPTDPNNPLQDIAYEYDLAGNIPAIHDRAPNSGTQSQPGKLDRQFSYDPLNRLLDATGRQCDALPSETPGNPWNDKPCCEDITQTKGYSEKYEYDPVGNITSLIHNGGSTGFTRNFAIAQGSNRLDKMNINGYLYSYAYDNNGNLVKENESRHYEWDHSDRMLVYRYQSDGSEPTSYVCSLYDSQGNRVKKLVRNKGGAVEVTVYIDGVFEHCRRIKQDGTASEEDNTLHIMDDQKRVATVRAGRFSDDNTPAVKYHLGDHLGSINVVIDDSSSWVNREEFTPYGETSFGSFARKRYRFTGKERDGESGLYYHGARYYAPWLGRWVSCDPKGMVDGVNLYLYAGNNPKCFIDSRGTDAEVPEKKEVVKEAVTAGGYGVAKGAPPGPTLVVPNSYDKVKMRAYGKGLVKREIGKVTDTDPVREESVHKAAERAFKKGVPKPAGSPPSGKWAADHIIELQHDATGTKGTSIKDFRWQDNSINSSEGAKSAILQKSEPGISGEKLLKGEKTPTLYGGITKEADAGKWYNSPKVRTGFRCAGIASSAYGAYTSGDKVAGAFVDDLTIEGSNFQHTSRTIAAEAGGWAGALAFGGKGAAIGATIGAPIAGVGALVGGILGGLIGGGIGFFVGKKAAEISIDIGIETTNARNFVPSDIR